MNEPTAKDYQRAFSTLIDNLPEVGNDHAFVMGYVLGSWFEPREMTTDRLALWRVWRGWQLARMLLTREDRCPRCLVVPKRFGYEGCLACVELCNEISVDIHGNPLCTPTA